MLHGGLVRGGVAAHLNDGRCRERARDRCRRVQMPAVLVETTRRGRGRDRDLLLRVVGGDVRAYVLNDFMRHQAKHRWLPVGLPLPAGPEWARPPLIATCAALSTRARAPSDPPAPLCVRACVSAHARTTRRGYGAREPPDDMTRKIRRNTHDLIVQSQNFVALRHHITNIK